MWRIHQDESKFTDAELIAWDNVLPYKHLPILDRDRAEVAKEVKRLESNYSKFTLAQVAHERGLRPFPPEPEEKKEEPVLVCVPRQLLIDIYHYLKTHGGNKLLDDLNRIL